MWRRLSTQLRTFSPSPSRSAARHIAAAATAATATTSPPSLPLTLRPAAAFLSHHFSTGSENVVTKKRVEDVMPIATGHEREELEAELQGRNILEIDHPEGPFGTKEAPAVVKSYYDRRIVGCPGVEGEDEHDVVWFWLKKGEPHECPVCSQYFVLEVVGPGGSPDGHDSEDEGHHH